MDVKTTRYRRNLKKRLVSERFSILNLGLIISGISLGTGESVTAIPADTFVDSIGVQTHWRFPNVYFNNYTGLKAKLAESGIRHLRDFTHPITYDRANDLYNGLGIKTHILVERRKSGPGRQPLDSTQIDEALNEIKTYALAVTYSLEAPNEYDLSHGSDTDWVNNIRNFSITLYMKAKADEMLRNLPVPRTFIPTVENGGVYGRKRL